MQSGFPGFLEKVNELSTLDPPAFLPVNNQLELSPVFFLWTRYSVPVGFNPHHSLLSSEIECGLHLLLLSDCFLRAGLFLYFPFRGGKTGPEFVTLSSFKLLFPFPGPLAVGLLP